MKEQLSENEIKQRRLKRGGLTLLGASIVLPLVAGLAESHYEKAGVNLSETAELALKYGATTLDALTCGTVGTLLASGPRGPMIIKPDTGLMVLGGATFAAAGTAIGYISRIIGKTLGNYLL